LLQIASSEGQYYRFGYTTNKTVLALKKYDGCVVMAFPPVSFCPTSIKLCLFDKPRPTEKIRE
jgi:hypothetical protein